MICLLVIATVFVLAGKNLNSNSPIIDYIKASTYPEYSYKPETENINGKTAYKWIVSPVGDEAFYKNFGANNRWSV